MTPKAYSPLNVIKIKKCVINQDDLVAKDRNPAQCGFTEKRVDFLVNLAEGAEVY